MHGIMAEDKNFNTLCTGKAIHTLMIHGLITKTYMLPTHWQTSCWQTPLRLDDLQYKETIKILQTILIPTSLWLSNTSQKPLQFTAPFASTIQTPFLPSTHYTTAPQCPACLLPSSFRPALPLPWTALATPLILSLPLLQTAPPATNWLSPMSKWSSTSLIFSISRKRKSAANSPQSTLSFPLTDPLPLLLLFSPPIHSCWLTPAHLSTTSMTMRALFHPLPCPTPGQNLKTTSTQSFPTALRFPAPNYFPFLPLTSMTACWSHPQSLLQPTPHIPCLSSPPSSKISHLIPLPLSPLWPWSCTNRPRLTHWRLKPWTLT